jgi:hypothetical protein
MRAVVRKKIELIGDLSGGLTPYYIKIPQDIVCGWPQRIILEPNFLKKHSETLPSIGIGGAKTHRQKLRSATKRALRRPAIPTLTG